ncbi:hypothetical protein D7147_05165 [Micromonospora musae]|uniref:YIP1 family protein n=1 Tax=Micromonospora musae TaxID=1894970 RepID=A0ABX9RET7_9ACTN|nr:hypothetical protein D7147_05165 [Micromonospora musae]
MQGLLRDEDAHAIFQATQVLTVRINLIPKLTVRSDSDLQLLAGLIEVRVSEPFGALEPRESSRGRRLVLAGIGLAVLGHLLALVAVVGAARSAGGGRGSDVDLEAGGRFGVAYAVLCTYLGTQTVLLAGVVIASAYGGQRLKVGLIAGWGGGLVLTVGVVVAWFVLGA